jgi:ATP-binding cassette, subfamily B, bacterial
MLKRLSYFKYSLHLIGLLGVLAYLNFEISFTILDLVNEVTSGNMSGFASYATDLAILLSAQIPLRLLFSFLRGRFIKNTLLKMKTEYIKKVFGKNINEFNKENNAKYISALTNDFNLIEIDYITGILKVLEGITNFLTGVIIIIIISPIILAVGIFVILVSVAISSIATRPVKKKNKERSTLLEEYSAFTKEVLSAFNIIKTNDLETRVFETFKKQSDKVQSKQYQIDKLISFVYALNNVNFGFTVFALLLTVSYLAITGIATIASVVVIIQNTFNIVGPIAELAEALPKIFTSNALFEKIDASLKNIEDYKENKSFDGFKKKIELKNVSFSYDNDLVLDDIALSFEKGKKYLVVGPSGGGKSTILRLLRKYFNPAKGTILIDGVNLKDIKKVDYFNKIANIEQQVFLFEDTLKNNLTLYKNYTNQEIMDAIKRAGLEDFLKNHAEGLKYKIVDNGKNVSGGEKSRIAIARGLLNKADIILLDEAFASLDYNKAKEIEDSILALKNVTIINVSHVKIKENLGKYDIIYSVNNKAVKVLK